MMELDLQLFLGKEHLVKNQLISTLKRYFSLKEQFFRVQKSSLHISKIG
jgi:hypothetical protein